MNIDEHFAAVEARQMKEYPSYAQLTGYSAPLCTPEQAREWTAEKPSPSRGVSPDTIYINPAPLEAAVYAQYPTLKAFAATIGYGNRERIADLCKRLGVAVEEVEL